MLATVPQVHAAEQPDDVVKKSYKHVINLAGGQSMLSQRISKEVLLVALGYNKRENLRNLSINHDQFARVLAGLHHGDPELALEGERNRQVVEILERVEELWPRFESALRESVSKGKVTRDGVGIVADLSLPLLEAMNETVAAFEGLSKQRGGYSLFEIYIGQASKLRTLSQKMAKEFLLVAYKHDVAKNRAALKKSMVQFERILTGLMIGDAELRLIPAPAGSLQAQLKAVDRVYNETKPILLEAVRGRKLSENHLADVASLNLILLAEADKAVLGFESF